MSEFEQQYFGGLCDYINQPIPPASDFKSHDGPIIGYASPGQFTAMFPDGTRSDGVDLSQVFNHMDVWADSGSVQLRGSAYFQAAPNGVGHEQMFPTRYVVDGVARLATIGILPPDPQPNKILRIANWLVGRRNRARFTFRNDGVESLN